MLLSNFLLRLRVSEMITLEDTCARVYCMYCTVFVFMENIRIISKIHL